MPLKSKPIYIIRPDEQRYCGPGFVPYYYEEELKDLTDVLDARVSVLEGN